MAKSICTLVAAAAVLFLLGLALWFIAVWNARRFADVIQDGRSVRYVAVRHELGNDLVFRAHFMPENSSLPHGEVVVLIQPLTLRGSPMIGGTSAIWLMQGGTTEFLSPQYMSVEDFARLWWKNGYGVYRNLPMHQP